MVIVIVVASTINAIAQAGTHERRSDGSQNFQLQCAKYGPVGNVPLRHGNVRVDMSVSVLRHESS